MSFIKQNMWGIGFVVILVGAFAAMGLASRGSSAPSGTEVSQSNINFTITDSDHTQGPANAKATLVEFLWPHQRVRTMLPYRRDRSADY